MIVPFRTADDRRREAVRVAAHLRMDGLICYPTETVYGLGCRIVPAPLERLAALKIREESRPFLLLVDDAERVPGLEWTDAARRLAAAFWPGPLTLALRARPGLFPDRVIGEDGLVAVRSSSHPAVAAILHALGEPITSTSANLPGRAPATAIDQAIEVFTALGAPEDLWLLDGGALPPSPPSTVVAADSARPRVLRSGAIPIDMLRTVVETVDD